MIRAALLLITLFFLFKINYFHCVLSYKFTKNFHAIFTSVYIMLISMFLNEDIIDIGKLDGICLLTFVVYEFSGLFSHPSIFSIIQSRFA